MSRQELIIKLGSIAWFPPLRFLRLQCNVSKSNKSIQAESNAQKEADGFIDQINLLYKKLI